MRGLEEKQTLSFVAKGRTSNWVSSPNAKLISEISIAKPKLSRGACDGLNPLYRHMLRVLILRGCQAEESLGGGA